MSVQMLEASPIMSRDGAPSRKGRVVTGQKLLRQATKEYAPRRDFVFRVLTGSAGLIHESRSMQNFVSKLTQQARPALSQTSLYRHSYTDARYLCAVSLSCAAFWEPLLLLAARFCLIVWLSHPLG